MSNGGKEPHVSVWRVIQLFSTVMTAVLLPLMGWGMATVVDLDKRMTATEANRFTTRDGAELLARIDTRLDGIERQLAKIPQQIPPPEVVRRLENLERKVESLERR